MMFGKEKQAKVLYDFQAQPNSGEITIICNQIVRILREDVGEGWWEGVNERGETGLFPAGYVEVIDSTTSNNYNSDSNNFTITNSNSNNNFTSQQHSTLQSPLVPQAVQYSGDLVSPNDDDIGWDDDWDDDDSQSGGGGGNSNDYQYQQQPQYQYQQNNQMSTTGQIGQSSQSLSTVGGGAKNHSAVKPSIIRFSTFVKSGGQDYILGLINKKVNSDDFVHIVIENNEVNWAPARDQYSCAITAPRKETKLKGLKSFIAYQLTPSFNNLQVSRRYKHFDWLHQRLETKYISIPIPPLPDKQITGRYENDFIERRQAQLQLCVNRICRHPVLSQSYLWTFFITCTADEKRWKAGKRRAEKDDLINASFFFTVQTPGAPLEISTVERQTEQFGKFVNRMDDSVKNFNIIGQEECKRYTSNRKDLSKLSQAFNQLANCFDSEKPFDQELGRSIKNTGAAYEAIAKMYDDQAKRDFDPMLDVLHEYRGILAAWPEILEIHKGALNKKRDHVKLADEAKIDSHSLEAVSQRADVVSYSTLAEINHFHKERISDFNGLMKNFLKAQIGLYENIVTQLKDALNNYG